MSQPIGDTSRHSLLDTELIELLARVRDEKQYYAPLSSDAPEYRLLQKLEDLGYVHYCPYPEEFWVIVGRGEGLLDMATDH